MNDKPTIPDVLPLAERYYSLPGNSCGGNLHICLDDYNVGDSSVEFCLDQAEEVNDEQGIELAQLLLKMSKTQRLKLAKSIGQL